MNRFSSVPISNSLRACVALALLLVGSAPAHAQTVAADRIRLNAGPCTIDSVNGSPDQVRLSDCSTITTATATNLTLQPTGDLVLSPTGVDVLPNTGYTVNLGALSNKYLTLHAAELWVETLVAQNTIATIGGRVLVGPTTTLTQDVGSSDAWVEVKHNQWDADDVVYAEANGSLEFLRVSWGEVSASSVGSWIGINNPWSAQFGAGVQFRIVGGACAGTWTSTGATYNGGTNRTEISVATAPAGCTTGQLTWWTDATDGNYRYFVVHNLDGSGANTWSAGDAVFSTGTTGDGFIDLYSASGVLSGSGPSIVGNVRTGTTYNNIAPRWAIGNLNGLFGYGATTYGAAFGDASATNVTIDATNGLRIRSGTTDKLVADTSGNLSLTGAFSIGTSGSFSSGATGYSTGTGWWMDYNGGTPRFRIGNPAGNQLTWDGTTLTVTGNGSGLTSISGGNITTGSITATQLAANSVQAAEIDVATLDAISANMGSITAGEIHLGGGYASGGLDMDTDGYTEITTLKAGNLNVENSATITGILNMAGTALINVDDIDMDAAGSLRARFMGGGGDQYVCVDNSGYLYASASCP